MILVDTSVWIDHLRKCNDHLVGLLRACAVMTHPFVIGEIASGNLRNHAEVIRLMKDLPQASVATDDEVLFFIDQHSLMGRGIGYIDAHLLAAASLTPPDLLWTRDKRLGLSAAEMNLSHRS
jgi:predicted nucleic acid-binding protein